MVYCDIPYKDTHGYEKKAYNFDHEAFYEWFKQHSDIPIYVSSYELPEPFIMLAETEKRVLLASKSNSIKATERIYANEVGYEMATYQIELFKENT